MEILNCPSPVSEPYLAHPLIVRGRNTQGYQAPWDIIGIEENNYQPVVNVSIRSPAHLLSSSSTTLHGLSTKKNNRIRRITEEEERTLKNQTRY